MQSGSLEQQTLSGLFTLEGAGIHSGKWGRVTVHPAEPDTGRVFRVGPVSIPAHVSSVIDTERCTTLGAEGARVSTVEHLLSALHGCGIDNAIIEVSGPEIPILDGSARPFVEAILAAGICSQGRLPRRLRLHEPVEIGEGGSLLTAAQADGCTLEVTTTFDGWPEGNATLRARLDSEDTARYGAEIAPARTFAFRQEVEALLAAGLAQGGSLENALIITPPDGFSTPLRLPSEWCAHKLLDLIGDLALLDARLDMKLTAVRPGHRINVRFAQTLLQSGQIQKE
ncbi:MAG TPA: UDP-3-O-acyl-N-acetylglucosamine deacetylase [Chthonomonadaceae bacterium]|nr:UDP-3-O-acyl-N-acetylglucosamine deacetylase [Chthonomonadaceae bacterium]